MDLFVDLVIDLLTLLRCLIGVFSDYSKYFQDLLKVVLFDWETQADVNTFYLKDGEVVSYEGDISVFRRLELGVKILFFYIFNELIFS